MISRAQKLKLGSFVLVGLGLAIAIVLVLAGGSWRERSIAAHTHFAESVQGLEIGAPVKFRGVPIGVVDDIAISSRDLDIRVEIKLNEDRIMPSNGHGAHEFLAEMVNERGARCRLELAGITGMKYIDINFHETGTPPPMPENESGDSFHIPSTPSLLQGLTTDFSAALMKIARIDFEAIGKQLENLLVSINSVVDESDLTKIATHTATTLEHVSKLAENLSATLSGDEINGIVADARGTLNKLDTLMAEAHKQLAEAQLGSLAKTANAELQAAQLPAVAKEAQATLASYRQTASELSQAISALQNSLGEVHGFAESARKAVAEMELAATATAARDLLNDAGSGLRGLDNLRLELAKSLNQMNRTLARIDGLATALDEDPSSLLRGKQKLPVKPGRE
jgi:paraquat-inducible protein B